MIKFRQNASGQYDVTFDESDTVSDLETCLQAEAKSRKWSRLNVAVITPGIIRMLKQFDINPNMSDDLMQAGLPVDDLEITNVEPSEYVNDCMGLAVTVENDGSIQETLPIRVYYDVVMDGDDPDGPATIMFTGANLFKKYHGFCSGTNLDDDPSKYGYYEETIGALYACGCGCPSDDMFETDDLSRLITDMKKEGFELIRNTDLLK